MKSALLIVALLVQTSLGQIAPAPEVPAVATPVAEVPAVATPVAEVPAVAAPVAEVPAVATPVAETPVAEGPVSDKVTKSQDRAGVETITSGIGVGIAGLQDILDGITNANEPPPTPSEGFQVCVTSLSRLIHAHVPFPIPPSRPSCDSSICLSHVDDLSRDDDTNNVVLLALPTPVEHPVHKYSS